MKRIFKVVPASTLALFAGLAFTSAASAINANQQQPVQPPVNPHQATTQPQFGTQSGLADVNSYAGKAGEQGQAEQTNELEASSYTEE